MATVKVADVAGAAVSDNITAMRLHCSVCSPRREKWCEHMSKVVSPSALDAKQIEAIGEDPTTVTIPLAPSKDVWTHVNVVALHRSGMHEVMLTVRGDNAEPKDEHLGVIAQGEGRYAIRMMLFDWLRYRFVECPPCSVATHEYGEKVFSKSSTLPRTDDPSWDNLLDVLSILTMGACMKCAGFLNFEDDVPEL